MDNSSLLLFVQTEHVDGDDDDDHCDDNDDDDDNASGDNIVDKNDATADKDAAADSRVYDD